MRKGILAIATLAVLAFAPPALSAPTTHDIAFGAPSTSPQGGATQYEWMGTFMNSIVGTATIDVQLVDAIAATAAWGAELTLNGHQVAGWTAFGGLQDSTSFSVVVGDYSYKLDVFVPNGDPSSSPVQSANISVVASAPGPIAGSGPAGLLMSLGLGGFALARVWAGKGAAKV